MSWSCSVNPRMVVGSNAISADFGRSRTGNSNNRGAILTNKYRLRWTVFIHFTLVLLMLFRLSVALYVMAGVRPPRFLQKLRIPPTRTWEYVWLFGNVVTCLVGVFGVWRNKATFVRLYAIGSLIGGLLPAIYAAAFDVRGDLMQFWETRQTKLVFQGVPVVILWAMFLAVVIQLHLYGLYFAWSLLSAWKNRTSATQRKIA